MVKHGVHSHMMNYTLNHTSTLFVDRVQRDLRCCGDTSYKEWPAVLELPSTRGLQVPPSCCNPNTLIPCPFHDLERLALFDGMDGRLGFSQEIISSTIYTEGCGPKLSEILERTTFECVAFVWVLSGLQLLQCWWCNLLSTGALNTLKNRDLMAPAPTWVSEVLGNSVTVIPLA